MSKFRKKPVVIEAVQLLWSTWSEMCEHAGVGKLADGKPEGCYVETTGTASVDAGDRDYGDGRGLRQAKCGIQIPTLEGVMLGVEGDWIIKGVAGEIYPCKPDIFAKSYEPADVDAGAVLALSPEEIKCLINAGAAYGAGRMVAGKPTSIVDGVLKKLAVAGGQKG